MIIPDGGRKQSLEEDPSLVRDIEHFIQSFGYVNLDNIHITAPKAKHPPR